MNCIKYKCHENRTKRLTVTAIKTNKTATILKREDLKNPDIYNSTFVSSSLIQNYMTVGKDMWP